MADETRAVRDMMTKIIYENLDGWSEEKIAQARKAIRELQRENEELKKRNAKLQKAVDRKDLNFIKNL